MDVETLIKAKKEKKMTLQEIAENSGIPKRTVDQIFSGKTKNPRIDTMQAIEKALGIGGQTPEISDTLSPDEKKLLDSFRRIPQEGKNAVLRLISSYLLAP